MINKKKKMNLEQLRNKINRLDEEIIELLIKRKKLIGEIGKIKKLLNKPIIDEEREQEIMERLKNLAKEKGLDENLVCPIYEIIIKNSRSEQEK